MDVARSGGREFRASESGFTLPEVMIVIVIMGILFGIATSSWFGVVERRAVDSATNQVASDLRLAHTRATNQLTDWAVTRDLSSLSVSPSLVPAADYYLVRIPSPPAVIGTADITRRYLPENTTLTTSVSVVMFKSRGDAQITGLGNVTVAADDGDPSNEIEVNTVTSRVRVVD